jgi:hypothetical protein
MAAYHVSIMGYVSSVFCMALLPQKQFWIPLVYYFGLEVIWEVAG